MGFEKALIMFFLVLATVFFGITTYIAMTENNVVLAVINSVTFVLLFVFIILASWLED